MLSARIINFSKSSKIIVSRLKYFSTQASLVAEWENAKSVDEIPGPKSVKFDSICSSPWKILQFAAKRAGGSV